MNRHTLFFMITFLCFPVLIFSQQGTKPVDPADGRASYYAKKFQGRTTANGESFNNYDYSAAHRTLPFNTYLNVINRDNGFNIIVRVNDRGPYTKNRVIDLTEAAARRIGGYHQGLVYVRVEVLDLLHLTPELEEIYHAHPVVDCLGNKAELKKFSLSLWSTNDLVHAIYISNDLYLKEDVSQVLVATQISGGKNRYHVIISGIEDKKSADTIKDEYERKGFMKVSYFSSSK